jgi:hypothetical protein
MIPSRVGLTTCWVVGWLVMGANILAAATSTPKVGGSAPGIVEQPIGRNVSVGGHVALSLSVTGAAPLAYQWWKNNQPVTNDTRAAGATNAVLNIDPVQTNDTGSYYAVVTNSNGAVTSAVVSVMANSIAVFSTVQGNTGLLMRIVGQIGDVYRIETGNFGPPWSTNGYATNYTGEAKYFFRFATGGASIRVLFDHMLPVLYPGIPPSLTRPVRAYGKLNQVWQLQATSNFQTWENVDQRQTNTTGWVTFREILPWVPPTRFYRIAPPP